MLEELIYAQQVVQGLKVVVLEPMEAVVVEV